MTSGAHLWLGLALIVVLAIQGFDCFKNVTMTVEPPYVQNGGHVTLGCHYDLEGAQLYSVKWYRGNREFYRYSPSENPPKKIFTFAGIYIDSTLSNETQVVLRNVGFGLAGNVSCEVTTETPGFKVKNAYGYLQVASLPQEPPKLLVNKDKFNVGDTLVANCSSSPSRPPASLSYYVNNAPVRASADVFASYQQTPENLYVSSSNLSMSLYPGDFVDGYSITLICRAEIDSIYQQDAPVVRIGSKNGDPRPERVRSPSGRGTAGAAVMTSWLVCACVLHSVFEAAT